MSELFERRDLILDEVEKRYGENASGPYVIDCPFCGEKDAMPVIYDRREWLSIDAVCSKCGDGIQFVRRKAQGY